MRVLVFEALDPRTREPLFVGTTTDLRKAAADIQATGSAACVRVIGRYADEEAPHGASGGVEEDGHARPR